MPHPDDDRQEDFRFAAFISYAHVDHRWAKWLHLTLESYRLPRSAAEGDRRLGKVFLDRSELATSSNLSSAIQEALDASEALIVVCSPRSAASRWVNEEVRRFRERGRGNRIFCLIVDGDPAGVLAPSPFPPAILATTAGEPPLEPLAADVRAGADGKRDALLKLIAGIRGLSFDTLRRREQGRRQRRLVLVATASTVLLVVMTALAIGQVVARHEAERQRDTAQMTATFLMNIFNGADPQYSQGREVTVRSMLDRSAADTLGSPQLKQAPNIRADLLSTLASVYVKLGSLQQAQQLLGSARVSGDQDGGRRLLQAAVGSEIAIQRADYDEARKIVSAALADRAVTQPDAKPQRIGLLAARAQVAVLTGHADEAQQDLSDARRLALSDPADPDEAARLLLVSAQAYLEAGNFDRAERRLRAVVAERRALGQPDHPDVLAASNSLGAIAARKGDVVTAEQAFREVVRLQEKVLGPDHPDTATTRGNLGRVLVEQRRFAEAKPVLVRARATLAEKAGPTLDTLANVDDSLGLTETGLGDAAAARDAFVRGLAIARLHAMPKEVELLADRAALECRAGDTPTGLKLVTDSRAALARFALPEPWRAARLDQVEAGCLIASGRRAEALPLVRRSADVVVQRWGATSLFGTMARRQQALLGIRS